MTVSPATRRLEAACALAPTILARAEETEARRELLPHLFETIADAGFLHMPLPRCFHCPELAEPAARVGLGETSLRFRVWSARETPL